MNNLGSSQEPQPTADFATIADVPIQVDSNRVNPNQIPSGVTRGTQKYVALDGSYVTLGLIPDGGSDIGVAFFTAAGKLISKSTSSTDYKYDINGNLIFKNDGKTQSIYNKATGKIIAQLGTQANGDAAVKFFDTNSIGLAQFGTFSDGTTALKVAKSGIEVATATNDQLIFNSNQDVFKIVKIIPMTTAIAYFANATPNGNQAAVTSVAHGLGFVPTPLANIVMDASASSQNGNSSADNYPNPGQLTGWVGSHLTDYVKATVTVDATNVYFRVMMDTAGFTNRTYTYTASVYLLQETFTAS